MITEVLVVRPFYDRCSMQQILTCQARKQHYMKDKAACQLTFEFEVVCNA